MTSAIASPETALLVVHLQHDIVSPGTAFGGLFNDQISRNNILAACNAAMTAVREAGGLVVPLRIAFRDDYSDLNRSIPLLAMAADAGALKDGSKGAAIVPDISVAESDNVLTHTSPGPFTDSELDALLRGRGITTVVVCGVATNASVEGAVRQAADLGYRTYVLTDACSAADAESHQASLNSLELFARQLQVSDLQS